MIMEIERKFLVKGDSWRESAVGLFYRQGYLALSQERVVRVRTTGGRGFLTIKGATKGISRPEYEYEIPVQDANEMLENLCERPLIEKKRYKIMHKGLIWEIDEFMAENRGLILAEVELSDENQEISAPEWIGEEVSEDSRYYNACLVKHPYNKWD